MKKGTIMPRPSSSFIALLCLLVSILPGCNQASPEVNTAKHLERASVFMEKGQLQEALIEYMNVTKNDPANAEAFYQMGVIHLKLGGLANLRRAFAELSRSLELDKNNRDAKVKIGQLYLLGNEPVKARQQADLILASAPQDKDALEIRGRSFMNEGRVQDGITELKQALALNPKNVALYLELARAYFLTQNRAAAEDILHQGLTANPNSVDIMLALGDHQLASGKPEIAEATFQRTVALAPDNEIARLRLTGFYQNANKLTEAESSLQQWASAYPQDERPHIHLGNFFYWVGVRDKAMTSYRRAAELNPKSVVARDKVISLLLDLGKVTEAEPQVKALIDKNAGDRSARFLNARLLLAQGKAADALPLFQSLIKDEPQFAPAHYFQGIAHLRNRQPAQAREAFTQAVKLNPTLTEAHTSLAELHLGEGSLDLALEHARTAIRLNPRNVQAAVVAGDAYLRKGDLVKSKTVYEAIAKSLPKEPIGPYRLGLVAQAEKNDGRALTYFEEALTLKPAAIEPLTHIALIKIAQGQPTEARERVLRQMPAAVTSALHQNLLGELWVAAKDTQQAEAAFRKAIELDNALLLAYMNLGQLYFQSGRTDQASAEYEAVLAKEPQAIQAHMVLGIIHEHKKEYAKAKARYEKILALNSKFAPAANNLAWLMVEQGGNLDVAFNYAQTAREQKPNDPAIADTMGWLYYKKNAYLLSISLLKEAVEKLPTNPHVHFHLGMAQYKNGDKNGAKKSLQTALTFDRSFPGSDEARKILSEL